MNYKPIPIGIDNFKKLITRGYYFIDKTLLIKDLLDNKADVNLFTRPRRFGKTLNMSMLQYFFEDRYSEFDESKQDNTYLFEGLDIMKQGEWYTSHMGKYPVINLSLKSAKQGTLDLAFQCIREEIANEFRRHQYILKSEKLKNEKEEFMRIANKENDMALYVTSLRFLSNCLEKYHNKKVIILIDEYDVPLENSFFEGFYNQMIKFIRSLFESALKTNSSLEFSVITGCLRISRESIFTGLNNLKIISILDDRYAEHFGFTNDEVKYIFRTKILKWFNEKIKAEDLSNLYTSIMNGEVDIFQKELNRLLRKTISFNDAHENFYHGFVVGILSHMDGYIVKSNREGGDGRRDIFIKPLSIFHRAAIIEMKVCDKPKEIFTKCDDALKQIDERSYEDDLNEEGYEDIIKYGMSFYRKDCLIKMK